MQGLELGYSAADPHFWENVLLPRTYIRAKAFLELGQIDEAKPLYDRLLGFELLRHNHTYYWQTLYDRGRIAEAEGDVSAAEDLYRRAVEVIEDERTTITTEASKIGFIGNKQEPYTRIVFLLAASGRTGDAFDYAERARSRALLDLLAARHDTAATNLFGARASAKLEALDKVEGELKVALNSNKPDEISKTRTVVHDLRSDLRRDDPQLASLVIGTVSTVTDIQALVRSGKALVSFFSSRDRLLAFVVTRTSIESVALNGTTMPEMVAEFRRKIADYRSDGWREDARVLYDRLIRPWRSKVSAKTLLIVPHGPLNYLPFAALQSETGALIDEFALQFLPSASTLPFIQGHSKDGGTHMLVFGNPDLGSPKLDLPFAEEEARKVAETRPGSMVLVRRQATAKAFRDSAGSYPFIHYAGHARFDARAPLESALYMTPSDGDDGRVTVADLYSLHLDADLVTLSACETGVGQLASGDEMIGLIRGFLYAGSRNIVTTLWEVDDRATAELMEAFYQAATGMPLHLALRAAQIKTRAGFPQPLFWSGLQMTGESESGELKEL